MGKLLQAMIDREHFYTTVRHHFGSLSQEQVDGFNGLLAIWEASTWSDLRWLAYALATTWHETGFRMQPVEEIGKGEGQPYGKPAGPYGHIYYGRGYVQLTWLENYEGATKRLQDLAYHGIDLVRYPEEALQPGMAALILYIGMQEGWFTGQKFAHYFTADKTDAYHARQIINALDKAAEIEGYFYVFLNAVGVPREMSDEIDDLGDDPVGDQ